MTQPDTTTMVFTDGHGREVRRTIKHTLDIRDYLGTRGYPWLVLAANRDLSVWDLVRYLALVSETTPGVARPKTWGHVRRKLFRPQTQGPAAPPVHNPDGQHERAVRIMVEHSTLSARTLVKLLREYGIKRGKDWVRSHRCDGLTADR